MTFTPLNILENDLTVYAKVSVRWLLSTGLCDCLCQYCGDGLVERLEISKYDASSLVLKTALVGAICESIRILEFFSVSVENVTENLLEITLNPYILLSRVNILTLILSAHKHGIPFIHMFLLQFQILIGN